MNEGVWYAVPSRGRWESIRNRTLDTLHRVGVPMERVAVFVADDEHDAYLEELRYTDVSIQRGALGMAANRNAILAAYPPGTELVQIDDDIADIVVRKDDKTLESMGAEEWASMTEMMFRHARRAGARLWGVYPVANPMFMRARLRADLTYICGNLYGCIAPGPGPSPLRPTLEDKEDYERTLACYAEDRAVMRAEWVSTRTRFYDAPGGMQTDGQRTEQRIRESAEELARRYPQWAKLNLTKRSGHAELRLRDPDGVVVVPR
jgi:hypothetical protein